MTTACILVMVLRLIVANRHCFWVEWVLGLSLFESCTNISRYDSIKPGIFEHLTEVVLRYGLGGVLLIE